MLDYSDLLELYSSLIIDRKRLKDVITKAMYDDI